MLSYKALGQDTLKKKAAEARRLASPCVLCGRKCRVERFPVGRESVQGHRVGVCETGQRAVVSSYGPHFGEEPPVTGLRGSGTIFFSRCNLKCIFCQNYDIAHLGYGKEVDDEDLAAIMLHLQALDCHSINLVSPTHVVPQILSALAIAVDKGLNLPLVYNTGGYDSPETVELLSGVVDIYMPDMKFGSAYGAEICSDAADYPEVNFEAVSEMHCQVGDLVTDKRDIAVRGLLVRHLVLPENLAATSEVMRFIAERISKETYVNIMDQYRPYYKARTHPVLGRCITEREYNNALRSAASFGLMRLAPR